MIEQLTKAHLRIALGAAACASLLALGVAAAGAVTVKPRQQIAATGIPVYGRWTITLHHRGHVTIRRFENALTTSGQAALTGLLTGAYANPGWEVVLGSGGNREGAIVDPRAAASLGDQTGDVLT